MRPQAFSSNQASNLGSRVLHVNCFTPAVSVGVCSGVSAVEGLPPVKSQSVYPSVFPSVFPSVSFGLIVSLLSYSGHGMPRMWCVDRCCRTRPGSGLARLDKHGFIES